MHHHQCQLSNPKTPIVITECHQEPEESCAELVLELNTWLNQVSLERIQGKPKLKTPAMHIPDLEKNALPENRSINSQFEANNPRNWPTRDWNLTNSPSTSHRSLQMIPRINVQNRRPTFLKKQAIHTRIHHKEGRFSSCSPHVDPNPQHHHAPRLSPLPRSSKPQETDSKTLAPSEIAPATQQKPQLCTHAMTSMADATTHAKTCRKRQEIGKLEARCDAVPEWRWCKLLRFRRGFGCE